MDTTGYAFVTGGASGISKAVCVALAKSGARGILVADINLKGADQTVKDCQASAKNPDFHAEAIEMDVTVENSVKAAIQHMLKVFGRIDYCINGAGILAEYASVNDASLESFRRTIDINVQGTFLVLRAAATAMASQQPILIDPTLPQRGMTRGSIVTLGSIASFIALPKGAPYVAAKHAVAGLTKSAAMDNIANNIRVNCVCPSFVDTTMMRGLFELAPSMKQTMENGLPMGRLALPEEVADLILFLCSPRSSYVNGGIFTVDGALTIGPHANVE